MELREQFLALNGFGLLEWILHDLQGYRWESTTLLGNVALSSAESFAEHAIAALLTILATVLNSILSFYNSILQYGVIGMSSLGLLGSIFAVIMLMGTFLGPLTAVKVVIKFIP